MDWHMEMMVFVDGGKKKCLEKNLQSKVRTNTKLNPQMEHEGELRSGHTGGRLVL